MKLLTNYILSRYIRYFIIVLISLQLFFVGIDFLQNFGDIPKSANLQLLYLFYNAFFAFTITLPLALVFGWIITLIVFIKNNEFVAFLSVGVKPKNIYLPIVGFTLLAISSLIFLQTTTLAYSYEQKNKIMDGKYFTDSKSDIFLKEGNSFIYFQKFYPIEQRAENIHIFKMDNRDIVENIVAPRAIFKDNRWEIYNAVTTTKPKEIIPNVSKIVSEKKEVIYSLDGFKPTILENVYESKSNLSITDAIQAIFLLNNQNVDTKSVRASLYYQAFVPFFIMPIILLVFVASSINSRFFNLAKFSSLTIFFTLLLWGGFFMLHKLSKGGVVTPELVILLPLFLWFIVGYIIFKKRVINY